MIQSLIKNAQTESQYSMYFVNHIGDNFIHDIKLKNLNYS